MKTKIFSALILATLAATAHAQSTFNKYQPANGVQCNTGVTYVDTACTSSQIPAGGSTGTLQFKDLSTGNLNGNSSSVVAGDGGLVLGAATGGSKGPGTINAPALYINGAAVGTSSGAVSSVGLSLPGIFTVTGSPVTAAGTLTGTLNTQSANTIWAGPTTGAAAAPTFRALVAADIPTIPASGVSGLATVATTGAYSDLTGKPTIPTAANPSGLIGLTAANGSATTFERSDATHALDQSIAPTWTGSHAFTGTLFRSTSVLSASVGLDGGINPAWVMSQTSGGTNSKVWEAYSDSSAQWHLALVNDALSSARDAIYVLRSGIATTNITLGNTTDYPGLTVDGPTTITNGNAGGSALVVGAATDTSNNITINSKGSGGSGILEINASGLEAWEFMDNQSGSTLLGVPSGAGGIGNVTGQPFYFGSSANVRMLDGLDVLGGTNVPNPATQGVYINNISSLPNVQWVNSSAGSDSKIWAQFGDASGTFHLQMINDAFNTGVDAFTVARSGTIATTATLKAGTLAFITPSGSMSFSNNNGSSNTLLLGAGVAMPTLTSSTSAQTGYVCWITGTGALSIDPTNTCLVSSIRYKQKVTDLGEGLDAVMKLRPVSYEYKPGFMPKGMDPGRQVGFIAEEVQKIDPRLTPLDKEGKPRAVEYAQMTALLARAIQDQQQEIWELRVALGALAVVSLTWLSALTWKRRRGHQ